MLHVNILTFFQLKFVCKNENLNSKIQIFLFGKSAEQKPFVKDYCLIRKDGEEIRNY